MTFKINRSTWIQIQRETITNGKQNEQKISFENCEFCTMNLSKLRLKKNHTVNVKSLGF